MKSYFSIVLFFCVLFSAKTGAQNAMFSLNANVGHVGSGGDISWTRPSWGTSQSAEVPFGKKWSFGIDLDWQFVNSHKVVSCGTWPNDICTGPVFTIYSHQFNVRPTVRYYFRKTLTGFYVGAYPSFGYLTVKTKNYPADDLGYILPVPKDPADDFGVGGGISYGYRWKLKKSLQVSVFASHQYLRMQNSLYKDQYDSELSLGINWLF